VNFRIASTFTDSLTRLTGEEQKLVKETQEIGAVADWLRARDVAHRAGVTHTVLDGRLAAITAMPGTAPEALNISTMHLAKGLGFRAVAVIACDDDVLPLQERVESAADEPALKDVYNTERHLLYVACTRARDRLLVTGVKLGSEFLQDMQEMRHTETLK